MQNRFANTYSISEHRDFLHALFRFCFTQHVNSNLSLQNLISSKLQIFKTICKRFSRTFYLTQEEIFLSSETN